MATFIQGVTDQISPLPLYTPDYNFLTQVYGTRQNEYNRGFNAMKGLINSSLNSPLQNAENERHRQEMFKKVQQGLKDIAQTDLSNPANVQKAMSLLDPITSDKEIAYDRYVTQKHQAERQKMEAIKNSPDEKVRRQYNDYSLIDMQYADTDLKNAKRGDGSILKVQPREFVPFEDVEGYLNQAAKDQKLEIVKVATANGYIHTVKNGDGAIIPYTHWAKTMMGNKFDRQFQVMARVNSESTIRGLAQRENISYDDAKIKIASNIQANQVALLQDEHAQLLADRDATKEFIDVVKKTYGDNIPAQYKEKYEKALVKYESSNEVIKTHSEEIARLAGTDPAELVGRITGLFENEVKTGVARNWAASTARATEQHDLKADEVVLTKWKIASDEKQTAMRIASQERIADAQNRIKLMELEQKRESDARTYELEVAKAKGEGKIAFEETLGTSTESGPTTYTGYEAMSSAQQKTTDNIYNAVMGADSGILKLVAGDKYNEYAGPLHKMIQISKGQITGIKLSETEAAALNELQQKIGLGTISAGGWNVVINDRRIVTKILNNLVGKLFERGKTSLTNNVAAGNHNGITKHRDAYEQVIVNMEKDLEITKDLNQKQAQIHQLISKEPQNWTEAKVIGYNFDGVPLYDLSSYKSKNPEKIEALKSMLGPEFANTSAVSKKIKFNTLTDAELAQVFMQNNELKEKADPMLVELSKLPYSKVREIIGNGFIVDYQPNAEMAVVTINVDPSKYKSVTGTSTESGEFRIAIPYEKIQAERGRLDRFDKYMQQNKVDNRTLLGRMSVFKTDQFATVSAYSYEKEMGFDYTIVGTIGTNGQRGVNASFKYKNPVNGQENVETKWYPIGSDEDYLAVSEAINTYRMRYDAAVKTHELQSRKK